jgi:hypothetical protein|eukprot:jgi/Chrpa1/24425/Chrysochromulina_OHIO_Genome00026710-RA
MMQYLVKWQGFEGEDTWEPTSALKDNRVFKAYKKAGKKVPVQNHTAAPVAPAPAAKAGAEPAAAELPVLRTAAPAVDPAPAAKPAVQRRAPQAAKLTAAKLTAAELAAAKLLELADTAKLATKSAAATKPTATKPGVARSARVHARRAPIAAAPIAQQLNFLTSSMDLLSDTCASADAVITDPDKVPKPAEEALAEAEETAEEALVVEAEETVAPPVAQHAQPAKRQRIGGPHQIAHIELDAEDGPPQIRMLPLEAGPFAGVWVEDGEQLEIIGALINDSRAGEIYQQVLYRCTSGYIKSKYIRYATEN